VAELLAVPGRCAVKSIRLHRGSKVTVTPVATVARMNGITIREVPALLAAWQKMRAIKPRPDGGFDVIKHVAPKDPTALRLLNAAPAARVQQATR
jgi:hypothetical protein